MYMRPLFTVASLGLLVTTACDPKTEFRSGKATLEGSARPFLTSSESYPANRTAWPCPLEPRGTGPTSPAAGFQSVGYEHSFDAGTPPFPCQWRVNHVHRLVAFFDLKPIPHPPTSVIIDSATLSFDKRRAAGDHDCADKILAAAGPGPEPGTSIHPASNDKWETPVPRLDSGACPGGRCTVEVTKQVNDWVLGIMPNEGFVLRGEDERLDANDNVSCRNDYANFRLDVAFRHEVKKGSIPIIKPIEASPITLTVRLEPGGAGPSVLYRLEWNGATGASVDIHRDGSKYLTTANDRIELDRAPRGTIKYKVCNLGTLVCSPEVTVTS